MVAAAGSGKTTCIIKEALKRDEEVLITTYTQANAAEIKNKIIKMNKTMPENITVQTWFSTLLQHGVRPYQGGLIDKRIKGMILVNKSSGIKYRNKNGNPVMYAEKENILKHYLTDDYKIYSDKISKFVVRTNQKSKGAVIDRLSRIYPNIFVDEVQDLAGHDLEIIKLLFKSSSKVLLVGDPRQVTYLTHLERKYKKYRNGKIKEFLNNECKSIQYEIDEETLNKTHRCTVKINDFAAQLYPEFKKCESAQKEFSDHQGVFIVKKKNVDQYLKRYSPVQLRDNVRVPVNKDFPVANFGESKGLTYDRVIIYPTKPMKDWLLDRKSKLKPQSRSKFYVALTRAKHSVAIVCDSKADMIDDAEEFIL